MEIVIVKDKEEMSILAAAAILKYIAKNPKGALGLTTGKTIKRTYELLVEDYKVNKTNWKKIKTFNLDEFLGINKSHPMSCHSYMNENLFNHINIDVKKVSFPNTFGGVESDFNNYDKLIEEQGGIGLQMLSISKTGSVGYNEIGTSSLSRTHDVIMSEESFEENSKIFKSVDEPPKKIVTLGIGSVLLSKKIILLASGESKADAIFKTFTLDPDEKFPMSILKLHPNLVLIVDEEAARRLPERRSMEINKSHANKAKTELWKELKMARKLYNRNDIDLEELEEIKKDCDLFEKLSESTYIYNSEKEVFQWMNKKSAVKFKFIELELIYNLSSRDIEKIKEDNWEQVEDKIKKTIKI